MILKSILLRYFLSGFTLNFIGFLFYILLLKFFKFSPILSVSISFPIMNFLYYFTQVMFVFKREVKILNFVKFIFNVLLIYFLNILLLLFFIETLLLDPVFSQFFVLIILVIFNFIVQKKIIFIK